MNVVVIHEKDYDDKIDTVIGVADSVENAEKVIRDYYGEFEVTKYTDIRDSGLEYQKVLKVEGLNGKHYLVEICLQWFELNN
jgi:hypothetical protein